MRKAFPEYVPVRRVLYSNKSEDLVKQFRDILNSYCENETVFKDLCVQYDEDVMIPLKEDSKTAKIPEDLWQGIAAMSFEMKSREFEWLMCHLKEIFKDSTVIVALSLEDTVIYDENGHLFFDNGEAAYEFRKLSSDGEEFVYEYELLTSNQEDFDKQKTAFEEYAYPPEVAYAVGNYPRFENINDD